MAKSLGLQNAEKAKAEADLATKKAIETLEIEQALLEKSRLDIIDFITDFGEQGAEIFREMYPDLAEQVLAK